MVHNEASHRFLAWRKRWGRSRQERSPTWCCVVGIGWKTFATRNESMLSYQMGDYSIAKLWTSYSPLLKARQTVGKNSGQ